MKVHLSLTVLFTALVCYASVDIPKQPSYFILGEEEFTGVQIYDVIQDKKLNYWFSTNEGLVYYDHYQYLKVVCDDSRSVSYFNFTKNSNNEIFCNNLNRQVFKLEEKKCHLIYEVSEEYANSFISLTATTSNELIIACNAIILINSKGEELQVLNQHSNMSGIPFNMANGDAIMSLGTDTLVVFHQGKLAYKTLTSQDLKLDDSEVFHFCELNGHLIGIKNMSKEIIEIDYATLRISRININQNLSRLLSIRIYQTNEHVWVAGTLPGIYYLKFENGELVTYPFYMNKYISDVYLDNEGNFILSTFNEGALIVQDLKIEDTFLKFENETVTSIELTPHNSIIFGTSAGKMGLIENDSFKIIYDKGVRPIDQIITSQHTDMVIFDDGFIRAYYLKSGQILNLHRASLKGGFIIDNDEIYLATNNGLVNFQISNSNIIQNNIKGLSFRSYSATYNPANKTIYASTVYGLFALNQNKLTEIKHKNESIYSSFLAYHDNQLYAVQSNSKLMVINNDNKVSQIDLPNYTNPLIIYKIVFNDNSAFLNSSQGLIMYNLTTKNFHFINSAYGIPRRPVIDFEIQENLLWVSTSEGFKKIDLNKVKNKPDKPILYLSSLEVNDISSPITDKQEYSSNQRKLSFKLAAPTLRHKNIIKYKYKLEGFDNQWQFNNYTDNTITYNSLPSGNFTFKAVAINGNQESELVQFHFSIKYPFYQRFWFISLCIFSFLIIVFLVYRRQLKIQRTKAKQQYELNASKLTAIQSQMNPHFIFNSLNSIQDLVLKGDVEHSYSYITTFSNLVRRTLNYSDKDFIDFDQEIKLIELYLSLEKLRFKNELNFKIETNQISDVQIPPMLIQPFIENALVHGLLHKKGEKKLTIEFKLAESLYCIIEDNGIGRQKASEIQKRQKKEHESFAVKAIRKRLEILSDYYKDKIGYQYEDLYEANDSTGTRVTLKIPYKNKY